MDINKIAALLMRSGIGSAKVKQKINQKVGKEELKEAQIKMERLSVKGLVESLLPISLADLHIPPVALFYRGEPEVLNNKCITIVGTREMTDYGKRVVELLLDPALANLDITIVSGLAYGIDAHVHKTCLDRGIKTAAVVAGGIDKGYPRGNQQIYDKIVDEGCVLAEYPPGKPIVKGMFPMRNRLLAALSDVTVVIEAPEKSGSLITAQLALDLGRDVYVVPGSIFNRNSVGVMNYIKQGAEIISSRDDFYKALDLDLGDVVDVRIAHLNKEFSNMGKLVEQLRVLDSFNYSQFVNTARPIIGMTNYVALLTRMEMEGILCRNSDRNYYTK